MTALAAFAQRVPLWVFGFVGATAVDRFGPVRMLWRANVVALLIAVAGLIAVCAGLSVALCVVVSSTAIACGRALEAPALTAVVTSLAENQKRQAINSLLDNAKRVGRLIAPMPALLLGTVSAQLLVVLAGVSFLCMGWLARSIQVQADLPYHAKVAKEPARFSSFRTIYRSGHLRVILGTSAVYASLHGAAYFSVLPRLLLDKSGGAVDSYAAIIGAFALGGILSNFVLAKQRIDRYSDGIALGMATAGLCFALLGQFDDPAIRWGLAFLGGASLPYQDILIIGLIQMQAPPAMLARAHALWRLGCEIGLGVGMVVGGLVADIINNPSTILIYIGCGIFMVSGFLARQTRLSQGACS